MRVLGIGAAAIVLGSLAPAAAAAPEDEPGPIAPPDTGIPGPRVDYATPPVLPRATKACSMRLPLCVHAAASIPGHDVLDVLSAAERAWSTLAGAMRLPPPDADLEDLAYHVYLVEGALEPAITRVAARDVRSRIDRARTFTVVDHARGAGCALHKLVAREIARAFVFRAAPATAAGVARAQTTALAELLVPCAADLTAAEAFQARPERAICDARTGTEGSAAEDPDVGVDPASERFLAGAALFWSRIDWAYGRGPGSLLTATWALAPTMTDVGAVRWHDEPDAFDVLRVSFKGALTTGSTLDDLLLDTAVARAFMGSAEDGLHAPETRALGDAARVRLDWDLPWPTRPKRVAPRAPVAPTGSSYLVIRRAGAPAGARLRVEIAWEEHALFRWAFVKLDVRGQELGRVLLPARDRATEAQMSLVDLDGVDRILLVGVNVGDPSYRFDPDDEVWEPHSWLVTMAEELP